MAVIIRTTDLDDSGKEIVVKQYRSIKPPTQKDIERANELDGFLESRMTQIRDILDDNGLLKSRQGDLARWHALGKHIGSFIDNPEIVPTEDRAQDRYIWVAVGQHAPDDLHPGKSSGNSKNTGTHRDHFRLCYLLAKLQPDFDKAEQQGTWRDWVTLLESKFIVQDVRILKWVREKIDANPGVKLRPLSKALRQELKDVHSEVLSDEELQEYMEEGWDALPK